MDEWKRIEAALGSLESHPDLSVREGVRELLRELMSLHGKALEELLKKMDSQVLEKVGEEPAINGVLLLHGLHPEGVETRIEKALEKVRPSLQAHHGDVQLLSIEESTVRLRLSGTCNGCPSSATTFRNLLEASIHELAPEIELIDVEGMVSSE